MSPPLDPQRPSSRTTSLGTDPIALFDRFLQVYGDATRRFGDLFPYNHLRQRVASMLSDRTARVTIRGPAHETVAVVEVGWCGGELRRVPEGGEPAISWSIDLEMLEDVAAEPWVFLARPTRFGFAWFPSATGSSEPMPPPAVSPASIAALATTR